MQLGKAKDLLVGHRYAICAAIIVACIAGLPQLIVRDALGSADKGIPYLVNDSEGEYLSRIREIFDGHISVASPTLYEYKESVTLIPPTGELLFYALPVKLSGISLPAYVTISKFLFPAILFLLSYFFILSLLTHNDEGARFSAIAGALLVTIGYDITNYRNLASIILDGSTSVSGLIWTRLVNPITGGILLFAFLLLLSRVVSGKGGLRTILSASFVLSVMVGYVFSLTYALAIPVLIALYFVWQKNWRMTVRVLTPAICAIGAIMTYVVVVLMRRADGLFMSDPQKAGLFFTHELLVNLISLATLAGVVLCFVLFFRRDASGEPQKRWWFVLLAIAVASMLVYCQQIFTGMTVWPQHYAQYTKIMSLVIVAILLHNILRPRAVRVWRLLTAILIVLALLLGWRSFVAASSNTISKYADLQSFSGVMQYLSANAPDDCVVYVSPAYPSELNRFIPGLTGCNVYHTFYIYSGIPSERIMHNYLVNLRLRGVAMKDVREHVLGEENIYFVTKSYFFRDWNDIFCCRDRWLASIGDKREIDRWYDALEKDIEVRYAEYLKGDFYAQLTKYRIDYMVVDTTLQPEINDKRHPFLSFKGRFDRFAVYSVIRSPNY